MKMFTGEKSMIMTKFFLPPERRLYKNMVGGGQKNKHSTAEYNSGMNWPKQNKAACGNAWRILQNWKLLDKNSWDISWDTWNFFRHL